MWLFGILSSPCIATLALRRCALDNAADFGLEVRDTIEESTYVDDCFCSVPDVKTALSLLKELPRMLKRGGFKLAKMISNSSEVMAATPEEDRVSEIVSFQDGVSGEDLALGMKLDLSADAFKPAFDQGILTRAVRSRREVLAVVAAVWLPLGLFLPFVVPAKVIIQRLASLKLSWAIPSEELHEFEDWRKGLLKIGKYEVPRWCK